MNFPFSRALVGVILLASAWEAAALGLGEMRTESTLGSRLVASVEVFLNNKEQVEADCFRLFAPATGSTDLPWVRRGKVEFRAGKPPRLVITSAQPINEPAVKMALQVACGYDLRHDYTILLSPPSGQPEEPELALTTSSRIGEADEEAAAAASKPKPRARLQYPPQPGMLPTTAAPSAAPGTPVAAPPRVVRVDADLATKPPVRVSPYKLRQADSLDRSALPGDRLVLSNGSEGGRSLRMSGFLNTLPEEMVEVSEARREVLRLEYRLYQLRNEPGVPADKMVELESVLASLHRSSAKPAAAIQATTPATTPLATAATTPATPATPAAPQPADAPKPEPAPAPELAAKPTAPAQPPLASEPAAEEGEFPYYLIFALLGLSGLLGWREYTRRRAGKTASSLFDLQPEDMAEVPETSPAPAAASAAPGNQKAGPSSQASRTPAPTRATVDVPLELESRAAPRAAVEPAVDMPLPMLNGPLVLSGLLDEGPAGDAPAPRLPEEAATPTVNPVMELAEIMLSFGRVKGAAQALQEYIDGNPKQALQPWIKLLDVYRMAGMREEFEQIAANLNQHFNVEILMWDTPMPGAEKVDLAFEPLEFEEIPIETPPVPPPTGMQKALTVENIPHIRDRLIQTWRTPACLDYLYQLLRDNRGGTRSGFTLPVVQELLFMIELLEFETKSTYNTEETGDSDE